MIAQREMCNGINGRTKVLAAEQSAKAFKLIKNDATLTSMAPPTSQVKQQTPRESARKVLSDNISTRCCKSGMEMLTALAEIMDNFVKL